jgi:hypothetical protein
MLRAAHLIGAVVLILSCVGTADARHYRYYWGQFFGGPPADRRFSREYPVDRATDGAAREHDPRFSLKRSGSTLGLAMDQLIAACGAEVAELKSLAGDLARTQKAEAKQATAFENVGRIADETANTLAANCPKETEAMPIGRLDALGRSLDAVATALDTVQPPLQELYASLKDEQAGLVASSGIASRDAGRSETSRLRTRARPPADRETGAGALREVPQASPEWNCGQWGAELRAWPIGRVEEIVRLGPRQRAAFYELAASFQHAADMLADSCLSEPATDLTTPPRQMAQLRKELDAVRQSITIIRPALGNFDALLDAGQRKRLQDAM